MKRRRPGTSSGGTWVGGKRTFPVYVQEPVPYKPDLLVWVDPAAGVVAYDLGDPLGPDTSLGKLLGQATRSPMVGRPRSPARVRVADEALAAEVRSEVPRRIAVEVGPTPEADDVFDSMFEMLGGVAEQCPEPPKGYVEGAGMDPALVHELFVEAEALYRAAPWEVLSDSDIVRVDIPTLGIEGACLCLIGALGESLGLIVFPSATAYDAFAARAGSGEVDDVGTDLLALTFEPLGELAPEVRKEVVRHGWPMASPHAYPIVERRDRQSMVMPLTARDLRLATLCTSSFTAFFRRMRAALEAGAPAGAELVVDGVDVRITSPYEKRQLEADWVEEGPALTEPGVPATLAKVGRNDPCPCGSGKKPKKCHGTWTEAQPPPPDRPTRHVAHEIDGRVLDRVMAFGQERYAAELDRAMDAFGPGMARTALGVPWAAYACSMGDGTLAEQYLERHGARLSREEREWIAAQGQAWLGLWEVVEILGSDRIRMQDLLSEEERVVHDAGAARSLTLRSAVVARVVDFRGASLLCGTYPRPLSPEGSAVVFAQAQKKLRKRAPVPVERLRSPKFAPWLVARWTEVLAALEARAAHPPELQNTDGEPFVMTIDHFELAPGARSEVEATVQALPGYRVEPHDDGGWALIRPGLSRNGALEDPVIGHVRFAKRDRLRVETNSVARANGLRKLLEEACGSHLRHRSREHADPLSAGQDQSGPIEAPPDVPPEVREAIREHKQAYYQQWLDQRIPALGGKTPRQAVRSRSGRAEVDQLLKEIEYHESCGQPDTAVDLGRIRAELGL